MAAPKGTLCSFRQEQKIFFRAEGWARAAQGVALRRCGEQGLAAGATTLLVDLRHCNHMDSTFLGTLLHLQRAIRRSGRGEFALVSPSPQCCRLMEQMGLDDVFATMAVDEAETSWEEVCCEMEAPDSFKCKVIQAHQELACLPGKAGEPFRQVVAGLMQDMEAKKVK